MKSFMTQADGGAFKKRKVWLALLGGLMLSALPFALQAQNNPRKARPIKALCEDVSVRGVDITLKPLVLGWHYMNLYEGKDHFIDGEFTSVFGPELVIARRLNKFFAMGVGTGLRIYSVGSSLQADLPLVFHTKFNFRDWKAVSPYFAFEAGFCDLFSSIDQTNYMRMFCYNPMVGLDFPCRRAGTGFLEARLFVYGDFNSVGFDVTAGFTFQTGKMRKKNKVTY